MYYEDYKPRVRKKKPRRRSGCGGAIGRFFLKLAVKLLAVVLLIAAALYFLPTALFRFERGGNYALNDSLPAEPYNVLFLGVDVLDDGRQRSDTMMIASIDGKELKLTSIQRDMVAEIDGHGSDKINAAFAYGGPELAVRTVNQALDMNIMRYVVVDFSVLVRMVDALGGIRMDITEKEMEHININVWKSRKVFAPQGYTASQLTEFGENVKLYGLRALAYARIRKLDSDFVRTSRQRRVVEAMLDKLRGSLWNPVVVTRFIKEGLSGVQTNLSVVEMLSLGEKALFSGEIRNMRLPVDGSYKDNGSTLTVTDREANVAALREFLYGG